MPAVECPQCQTINEVDFGLTPCSNCGLMLLPPEEDNLQNENGVGNQDAAQSVVDHSDLDSPEEPRPAEFANDEALETPPTVNSIAEELSEENSNSDLPFSYELTIGDLDLPERMSAALEIVAHPSLRIKMEEAVFPADPSERRGELVIRGLNAFQASSLVRECLRANFKINWKQVT